MIRLSSTWQIDNTRVLWRDLPKHGVALETNAFLSQLCPSKAVLADATGAVLPHNHEPDSACKCKALVDGKMYAQSLQSVWVVG
jgi:hypothetical protein